MSVLLNYHIGCVFLVRCVLEFRCGWVGVVSVLQASGHVFLVRCVLEFRCGWVGVVSVLQAEACYTDTMPTQTTLKLQHTSNQEHTTNVVIQQNSCKLLMMDILMSETC